MANKAETNDQEILTQEKVILEKIEELEDLIETSGKDVSDETLQEWKDDLEALEEELETLQSYKKD